MKRLLLLLCLVCSLVVTQAQETHRFNTNSPQGFSIISSRASGISLHYSIQEIGIANIDNGEVKGQEIVLKGQFAPNAEGRPNLPVVNRYVAIPQGATVHLQTKEKSSTTLRDIDLLPAMPIRTDFAEGLPSLNWDSTIFGKDALFPRENVVLSAPTQIRGLDVVLLSVTPFRYNPVKKTLEVVYDLDIELRFEGGNGQFGESRYLNPDWRHILSNLVINNDMLPTTDYYGLCKSAQERDEDGCEYLIISPDDPNILAWADTLKAFRTKQGISTKIVSLSECGGSNAVGIRNYILNAYTNWAIPPAAVLLFGGYQSGQGIPPFFHYTITDEYMSQRYPTDYPYSDMNGDSLADVALSRVTARNVNEYRTFVEKTIQYESNPPTDASFYDKPIITVGHESNKWFMISSQSINGFYRDKLGKHPTDLYMLVSGSGAPSNPEWSTGYNTEVLIDYFGPNGQNYVPESMESLHDWIDSEDNSMLLSALNEGSFLTMYRDHSNYNAWWSPSFNDDNVDMLENKDLTFVLSIGCSTTLFTEYGKCLIDAFCTKESGGAVGGIGASSLTYSYFNDILAWGIYDCIWPNFLPDLGSDTPPDFVRPSYVLSEAKHYFAYHVFLPDWWIAKEHSTMHLFGYTGETYLNLYTEEPQPLQITHGLFQPVGTNQYSVTAEEGAVICLSKDGEIIDVARSEGDPHTFVLPEMEVGEHFTVTATKQNRFRYEYEVTIIPDSGPYVILEKDGLIIENEFDVLHNGEDAHFGLILHNYGNDPAENITMNLTCDSDFIEIEQGTCQTHNLAPDQTITINGAFHFNIADMTPDMTQVVFTLRIDDGNGEKESHLVQNIAAPLLVVKPNVSFMNENRQIMLQIANEGFTHVHLPIANEGHFDSEPVNLNFEIMAPFITIDSSSRMFNTIAKGETKDVVFSAAVQDNSIDEGWLNSTITLNDRLHQITTNLLLPYGCFNESFQPNYFNSHHWTMSGELPWVLTNVDAYSDGYCAKSGPIDDDQSSSMLITLTTEDTDISFYKKVSSESGYDKLHFYIDDVEKGQWSGSLPWSEERYHVTQGTHTFKWSYTKDSSMDSGFDCAWIDNFNIEPLFTPIAFSGDSLTACKNESVHINHSYAYHFQNLEWTTMGDGVFEDNHAIQPEYVPGPNDLANDGALLQLHVDGTISPLQLTLTDEINLTGEIAGDDLINPEETLFSHYAIVDQGGMDYVWQLTPEEAGVIYSQGPEVDIVWNYSSYITEATLTVKADATCVQAPLSKTIHINVLSSSECTSPSFTLFPNPTDGTVHVLLGQDLPGKTVVEVIHVLGTRVTANTFQNLTKGQTFDLDLQHCSPGMYIIRLCGEEGCWGQKVSVR